MLPLMFFFMTTNKKRQCYPLCFFSWRPIKNDSVTPCVFFHDDQRKTTVLPLMFLFMTTNKITTVLPLMFHLKKTTVLPLMFCSWRPIKNDSVTPYVSFDENDSVTPHVSFDKNDSVTPYVIFPWWLMKNYLFDKDNFFFMTTNK